MRVAAVRTLAMMIALSALAIPLALVDHGIILIGLLAIVPIIWLVTLVARRPQVFVRVVMIVVIALLAIPLALESSAWNGNASRMHLTPRERAAFLHLRTIRTFEMPVIGFAPEYSSGYVAMRILGRSLDADAAFKQLLETGTPAGQLYGLIGVHRTDPLRFRSAVPRYQRTNAGVEQFWGCVISHEPVAEITAQIASGSYPRIFLEPGPDEAGARLAEAAFR